MSEVCEKLIRLALSSENIDEAVAALRKARKQQPEGKLQFSIDVEWNNLLSERDAFVQERDAFEAERQEYQRRVIAKEKNSVVLSVGSAVLRLAGTTRRLIALGILAVVFAGQAAF